MNNLVMLSATVESSSGLDGIFEWLEIIGTMIWTSTKGFFFMITAVIESLRLPPILQQFLPTFMGSFCFAVVLIAVIKGIFGR